MCVPLWQGRQRKDSGDSASLPAALLPFLGLSVGPVWHLHRNTEHRQEWRRYPLQASQHLTDMLVHLHPQQVWPTYLHLPREESLPMTSCPIQASPPVASRSSTPQEAQA